MLMKSLKGMEIAVNALNKENVGLTNIHCVFLKTCIKTKMYKRGLSVACNLPCEITKEASILIFHIISNFIDIKTRDFVSFFYYSGLIHLGLEVNSFEIYLKLLEI